MTPLFVGLDVGTSGARALAVTARGEIAARASQALPPSRMPAPGHVEQHPADWRTAALETLTGLVAALRDAGHAPDAVRALAVTSTSGTLVAVDAAGQPLRPALMYNDARAAAEAEEASDKTGALREALGYRFNASFGLPKILWLLRHEPDIAERCALFLHAADWIAAQLTQAAPVTDPSNALKTGYDPVRRRWPDELAALGVPLDKLPPVHPSGTQVGTLAAAVAAQTGLPAGMAIVAGATDGTAGALAAGIAAPGEAATVLGSTLVVKAVSVRPTRHDAVRPAYSHVHPAGGWLPGGASNTGGAVLEARFGAARLAELDCAAARRLPTPVLLYPLLGAGERFPLARPAMAELRCGEPRDEAEWYAAHLQGIAFVERLAYETLAELGCPPVRVVSSSGGGAKNPIWSHVRAAVLGCELRCVAGCESALGAAMLAAAPAAFGGDVRAAVTTMAHMAGQCLPAQGQRDRYEELYQRFRRAVLEAANAC